MSGFARQGLRLIAKNCRLCQYSTGELSAPLAPSAKNTLRGLGLLLDETAPGELFWIGIYRLI